MMRDIGAFFYCVKITSKVNTTIKTEAMAIAGLSQLVVGIYGDR